MLKGFLFGIALVLTLIYNMGNLLAYSETQGSWWVRDVQIYQQGIAKERNDTPTAKKTLYVVAGSSGLFGFDHHLIEQQTDYQSINFATHAGLSMNNSAARLEDVLKEGDVILMPLEYSYYYQGNVTTFQQREHLNWMQRDAYWLSPVENFKTNQTTPMRVWGPIAWARLTKGTKNLDRRSFSQLQDIVANSVDEQNGRHFKGGVTMYDFMTTDRWGGFYYTNVTWDRVKNSKFALPRVDFTSRAKAIDSSLHAVEALAKRRNAKVIYTWPAAARMQEKHVVDAVMEEYGRFQDDMIASGRNFKCRADESILPLNLFIDTGFHLNSLGATLRTVNLLNCLKSEPGFESVDLETIGELKTLDQLHGLTQIRKQRKAVLFNFEQYNEIIFAAKQVIDNLPSNHANVPKMKRLRNTVIMDALPEIEARLERSIYVKMVGNDYKIIAQGTKDCDYLLELIPQAIDNKRSCSFGIWTDAAADW